MSPSSRVRLLSLPIRQKTPSTASPPSTDNECSPPRRIQTLPEIPSGTHAADLNVGPSQHVPFNFGAEFELILRPKRIACLPSVSTRWREPPTSHANEREKRDFGTALLSDIAFLLTNAGFPANHYDLNNESKPDYSKWNVMMDGSPSKRHRVKGFCKCCGHSP